MNKILTILVFVTVALSGFLIGGHNASYFGAVCPSPLVQVSPTETPFPIGRLGPDSIYPDLSRTPGEVNPDITQDTIAQTLCNPAWSTRSIRPPASYTTALKIKQMTAWGLPGTTKDYEEDHLISLELGGNPTDPKNLWPEPYTTVPAEGGAKTKDQVENYLHRAICSGNLTLKEAQNLIVNDWYEVYQSQNTTSPLGGVSDPDDR